MIRNLKAVRYITPLREGGSLPALVEGDDGQTYVLKFRGAGQGRKALIAEWIAGEMARALGLNVPTLALMALDAEFGNGEPDPEIQDLLRASVGLNLAMKYLPGALAFDILSQKPSAGHASKIVWFDAYVMNVDRTIKNPNLLSWEEGVWLIDHGASLYFHHTWDSFRSRIQSPFPPIRDHLLLPYATALRGADAEATAVLKPKLLTQIVNDLPDDWLTDEAPFYSPELLRAAYLEFLTLRLSEPRAFVETALALVP